MTIPSYGYTRISTTIPSYRDAGQAGATTIVVGAIAARGNCDGRSQPARCGELRGRAAKWIVAIFAGPYGTDAVYMVTLAERFSPRQNAFDILRLALALTVAFCHLIAIGYGWQPRWDSGLTLSGLGVHGFFVLSGFLVTRSYLSLASFPRFAWHRFLRIMPAFWVCLLVTAFVMAPIMAQVEGRPVRSILWGANSSLTYVLSNAFLAIFQSGISGLLATTPIPEDVDVALWSLAFEAVCYSMVALLGVLAVLQKRRWIVLAMGIFLWGLTIVQEMTGPLPHAVALALSLVNLFVLGMIGYLYRDWVPASGMIALASSAVFLLCTFTLTDYQAGAAPAFAYLLLWFGACSPLRLRVSNDFSYGVYIYHWPVLQLLAVAGVATASPALFVLASVPLVGALAVASWFVVERPALARRHSALPDRVAARVRRREPQLNGAGR